MAMTACHRVLNTVELLESILLQVDYLPTVLLAQRVNHTFQATICESVLLQRHLWFEPEHATSKAPMQYNPFFSPPWTHYERCAWQLPIIIIGPVREEYRRLAARRNLRIEDVESTGGESWRKMILVNQNVAYVTEFECSTDDQWRRIDIQCDGFTRAGSLEAQVVKRHGLFRASNRVDQDTERKRKRFRQHWEEGRRTRHWYLKLKTLPPHWRN